MVDYCDIRFNWECDKDPSCITDYVHADLQESEGKESQSVQCGSNLTVFRRPESDAAGGGCDRHCEVEVQCKSRHHVGITRLRVVSESRNVEVYDRSEGYLHTVRGEGIENGGDDPNNTKVFMSDVVKKEPTLCLTLKFMSLKERLSFDIRRIQIHVTHMDPPKSSQVDIVKLRNHIQELGDQVSDRAVALLDTMENYQNNQRGAMDNLQSMMTQGSQKENPMSAMTGLLSLFSQMNQPKPDKSVLQEDARTNDPSYLADQVLSQMSASGSGSALHGEDMHHFLQAVCGKVTALRHPSSGDTGPGKEELKPQSSDGKTDVNMDPAFMEEVGKQIQTAEQRIMSDVEKKMTSMETRLSKKMDRILKLLLPDEEEDDG